MYPLSTSPVGKFEEKSQAESNNNKRESLTVH